MDAITEKRKKKSRKYKKEQEQEKHSAEEKSTFHCKWNTNEPGTLKLTGTAQNWLFWSYFDWKCTTFLNAQIGEMVKCFMIN